MKPSRVFRRLAPGLAAGALLAVTAGPARAADPPKGPLRSREFSAAELAVSSSHVPLDDVLGELPNRGALERFRSERASAVVDRGAQECRARPHLRRSAKRSRHRHHRALPAVAGRRRRQPRHPGGSARPPGTRDRAGRRRGRGRSRARFPSGASRPGRDRRRPAGGAAGDAGLRHAVAGQRAPGRQRHHRARRAAGPDHQPRQRGGLRHRGLGHGRPARQSGPDRGEGPGLRLRLRRRPFARPMSCWRRRPSRSWPRRRRERVPTSPTRARSAVATCTGWSTA